MARNYLVEEAKEYPMQRVMFRAAMIMALLSGPVAAQEERALLRSQLSDELRNSDIGAGYAQMLNFFVDPSISASRLEADDGTEYDVFKVPLQVEFPLNEGRWQLLVRGTLSHATAENEFSLIDGETIDGTWEADSGQLGVGLLIPAGDRLSWFVAGQVGISRLENEADYNDGLAEEIVAPVADGILFNWDTNAHVSSLTGGLDYQQSLDGRYDLDITARYTYSHIASYSESRDLPSFSEDTGTFSAKADLEHPMAATLWDLPLFGVAHVGGTAFTGPSRKALGFSHFYEIGYSVGMDVAERSRYFSAFSIGYQYITGSDVDGYSLLFGWRLK